MQCSSCKVLCKLVGCRGTSKCPKAAGDPYEVTAFGLQSFNARHNSAGVSQTDESDDFVPWIPRVNFLL